MTSPQKFPDVINISAHGDAFVLQVDKVSMFYKDFDNLAQDIKPKIRPEFKMDSTAEYAGSC